MGFFFLKIQMYCKLRSVGSVPIVSLRITNLVWRNPLNPDSFNHNKVWRSHPGFSGDLEPVDIQGQSVTPPGSHLSGHRGLNCIPSATGHLCWSSSWTEKWMGMLMMKTMGMLLTVVFFLHALTPSLLSSLPAVSSLKSTLKVHLEQNDLTPLQGLEFKPDNITLRHRMDVLSVAVQSKRRWS